MLSSMTNCNLRMELEALCHDLDQHRTELNRGGGGGMNFGYKVELYKMKIARVDALQAFAKVQFVISKMEQSAIYAANIRHRNAANRRRNFRKRSHTAPRNQQICPNSKPPLDAVASSTLDLLVTTDNTTRNIDHSNANVNIKVECNQSRKRKRSRGARRNSKKAKLLKIKLEDVKQEIES